MNHARTVFALTLSSAALVAVTAAGPLNPPAGAVSSTAKPLSEVEPRIAVNTTNTPGDADSVLRITAPGSYYLAGNVAGVTAKHGIEIAASNVTLDLNGFDVAGVSGSLSGVYVSIASPQNVCVRNGTVRSWGTDGIDITGSNGAGQNGTVEGVRATDNGRIGINAGGGPIIRDCTVRANVMHGIAAGTYATITGCVARDNGNGAATGHGISTGDGANITGCNAASNGLGAGGGNGFTTGQLSRVEHCIADRNGAAAAVNRHGITVAAGCTVADCTATINSGDGILVSTQCVVVNNTCVANGFSTGDGANIHVTGGSGRVEGNRCDNADRGIEVSGSGTFVSRNMCSNHTTNYVIAAGNYALVVSGTTSAAISGSSGGASWGSTDPNANYAR